MKIFDSTKIASILFESNESSMQIKIISILKNQCCNQQRSVIIKKSIKTKITQKNTGCTTKCRTG